MIFKNWTTLLYLWREWERWNKKFKQSGVRFENIFFFTFCQMKTKKENLLSRILFSFLIRKKKRKSSTENKKLFPQKLKDFWCCFFRNKRKGQTWIFSKISNNKVIWGKKKENIFCQNLREQKVFSSANFFWIKELEVQKNFFRSEKFLLIEWFLWSWQTLPKKSSCDWFSKSNTTFVQKKF